VHGKRRTAVAALARTFPLNLVEVSGGTGDQRVADVPAFIRTSAPDANACVACHAEPSSGGSGDFVANVFVLAQARDPVVDSLSSAFSNERNSLGMHGSGAIEMPAREMTADLNRQAAGLRDGAHTLVTKGVVFEVTMAGGAVTDSAGVDKDLVIKPFHQAGVVVSLREFTVNAMNHHHGMQAEERFDLNAAKSFDPVFDEDGVERELTTGDITAVTLYQAALGIPQRVLPVSAPARRSAQRGERVFTAIGCGECHVPALQLDDPVFAEPNPRNPVGTFADAAQTYRFDLTRQGEYPRLERDAKGRAIVRAYTDLKRHNLCDREGTPGAIRHFCNERLDQGRPAQGGRPGRELFLTRKLWDVGSSAPYGHRGDLRVAARVIPIVKVLDGAARDVRLGQLGVDRERLFDRTLRFRHDLVPRHHAEGLERGVGVREARVREGKHYAI
jgi:hypothetical protein